MKKKLKLCICLLILTIILTSCNSNNNDKTAEKKEINYQSASYAFDIYNPREVIGFGDYVFVAQVNEELRTEYSDDRVRNGKKVGFPCTVYSITVIDNLKGNIKKNTPIELVKVGGFDEDYNCITLRDGDELLETGKYYIITASATSKGKLSQVTPTAAIKLNYSNKSEIMSCSEYKDYKKYCKEEIKFEKQRFKSKYENDNE